MSIMYSYSRKQAIEDGVLIELPKELCSDAGVKVHVAVTSALYHKYIYTEEVGQDEVGRMWDLLMVFRVQANGSNKDTIYFVVIFKIDDVDKAVRLKAIIGPGDTMEPVLTIMLENED